jgi:arginine utilization protein RocB
MENNIFFWAVIIIAIISIVMSGFSIFLLFNIQAYEVEKEQIYKEMKKNFDEEIEENKEKMKRAIKEYYNLVNKVAQREFTDIETLLNKKIIKITDTINSFEDSINFINIQIKEIDEKLIEKNNENVVLKNKNNKLNNILNRKEKRINKLLEELKSK